MALKERIEKEYMAAMKEGKAQVVSTLRLLRAAIKNGEIDKMKKFEDTDIEAVIRTEAKKLKETLVMATEANRPEMATQAEVELQLLAAYLPEQLDESAVRAIVAEKIKALSREAGSASGGGTLTDKDFGRVTGEVMKDLKGKADGAMVSRIIKESLTVKT
jgi:hypothetical protein